MLSVCAPTMGGKTSADSSPEHLGLKAVIVRTLEGGAECRAEQDQGWWMGYL